LVKGGMRYRHPNLTFRSAPLAHDHVNQYTDPGSIRGIVEAVT
jgi:hypothetical protein